MKSLLIFVLVSGVHLCSASTIISVKCGNWTDAETWDLARIPLPEDTILVNTYLLFDADFISLSPGFLQITKCGELCGNNSYSGHFLFNGPASLLIINADYGHSETNAFVRSLELIHVHNAGTSLSMHGGGCVGCDFTCEDCNTRSSPQTDCAPIGFEKLTLGHSIKCFPNPASDKLLVTGIQIKSELTLFDIAGNKVFKSNVSSDTELQLQDLSSGIYYLQIISASGSSIKKLMVSH